LPTFPVKPPNTLRAHYSQKPPPYTNPSL